MKKKYPFGQIVGLLLFCCFWSSASLAQVDAELTSINAPTPGTLCTNVVNPNFTMSNVGTGTIALIFYTYQLDSEDPVQQIWTGTLEEGNAVNIDLPALNLTSGSHTFSVTIGNVNNQPDSNPINNQESVDFSIVAGQSFSLELFTDDFGGETSFDITDANGEVLFEEEAGNFAGGSLYNFDYCLDYGCYTFNIYDAFGDGICCGFGEGYYTLTDGYGMELATGGNFGSGESIDFCLEEIILEDLDAALTEIISPIGGQTCTETIYPSVVLRNDGNAVLTSATISYFLNGDLVGNYDWMGALASLQNVEIELPNIDVTPGDYNLNFVLTSIDGNPTDDFEDNNEIAVDFSVIDGNGFTVNLTTLGFGGGGPPIPPSIRYELADTEGNVIDQDGPLDSESNFILDYCLEGGCYTFTVIDDFQFGLASFDIESAAGYTLAVSQEFLDEISVLFCTDVEPISNDGALVEAIEPIENAILCNSNVGTTLAFQNVGTDIITSAIFSYSFNGGTAEEYTWTGSLNEFDVTAISLPTTTLTPNDYELTVTIVEVNGAVDVNTGNNTFSNTFSVVEGDAITITTNGANPFQHYYTITDVLGNELIYFDDFEFGGGPGGGAPTITEHCLAYGCYTLTVFGDDGLGGGGPGGGGGNGSLEIDLPDGSTLEIDGDFNGSASVDFCTGDAMLPNLDVGLFGLESPVNNTSCANSVVPQVAVKNVGQMTVTDLSFSYEIAETGLNESYNWSGTINTNETQTISLPTLEGLAVGTYTLSIDITTVNGGSDDLLENNNLVASFDINEGLPLSINLSTGGFQFIEMEIEDENGQTVYYQTDFPNDSDLDLEYCLAPGCYTLLVNNPFGGGGGGGGSDFIATLYDGTVVAEDNNINGDDEYEFCIEDLDLSGTNASLIDILAPNEGTYCNNNLEPVIQIQNLGEENITELVIVYDVGGDTFEYTWTGFIQPFGISDITLPVIEGLVIGDYLLNFEITSVNGIADEEPADNSANINFTLIEGEQLELAIFTSQSSPQQNSYIITSFEGEEVVFFDDFTAASLNTQIHCLPDGCYTFTIFDSNANGMLGGSIDIILPNGQSFFIDGLFGAEASQDFCIGDVDLPNLDVGLVEIISPDETPACSATPIIEVRNFGLDAITSLTIEYGVSGDLQTYEWFGILNMFESTEIELPSLTPPPGGYTLEVNITGVNGAMDEMTDNNVASTSIDIIAGTPVNFDLQTDQWGEEVSYQIIDMNGNAVIQDGDFDDNAAFNFQYCLSPGCYTFDLFDTYGDGGATITIADNLGNILLDVDANEYGDFFSEEFCISNPVALDAALVDLVSPNAAILCANSISPQVEFQNLGTTMVTMAEISYSIDGNSSVYNWEGSLNTFESTLLTLPTIEGLDLGEHTLEISLVSVNGETDEESSNDMASFSFSVTDGAGATVVLMTDAFANENSYVIVDENGNVVYDSGEFEQGFSTFENVYCLENACYDLILLDDFGDGGPSIEILDEAGMVLGAGSEFTDSLVLSFCLEADTMVDDTMNTSLEIYNLANNIEIYPNPAVAQVVINHIFAQSLQLELSDLNGRVVMEAVLTEPSTVIDLPKDLAVGVYVVKLTDGRSQYIKKLVVAK